MDRKYTGVITNENTGKENQANIVADGFEDALEKLGKTVWSEIRPKLVVLTDQDNNTKSFTHKEICDLLSLD